jgi:hypothetical protein
LSSVLEPFTAASGDRAKTPGLSFFFAATFFITWLLLLPAALALLELIPGPAQRFALPAVLATLAPLSAAVLAARSEATGIGLLTSLQKRGEMSAPVPGRSIATGALWDPGSYAFDLGLGLTAAASASRNR